MATKGKPRVSTAKTKHTFPALKGVEPVQQAISYVHDFTSFNGLKPSPFLIDGKEYLL